MLCACIDIGTNTIRVLVAEAGADGLSERQEQRVYTGLGSAREAGGPVPAHVVEEVAGVVAAQSAFARRAGARDVCVVATAAVRTAPDPAALLAALDRAAGCPVRMLDGHEEARLAFRGATGTHARVLAGRVAVVDVGGGSTELAVGTISAGATWTASRPLGSGSLTRAYLHGDPPTRAELTQLRERARAVLDDVDAPPVDAAVAVGGGAASLRRVVGPVLDRAAAEEALARLCAAPARETARLLGLEPERARLLPAGILALLAAAERLGRALEMGSGGLREGVLLERAAGRLL